MKKNLFSQKTKKEQKKPYRPRPIRRVGKIPKQTSKERYYKDKAIRTMKDIDEIERSPKYTLNVPGGLK